MNEENGRPTPFVLVGNEVCVLKEHALRPYPCRSLSTKQLVFNNRLTTIVQCSFGIPVNK